MLRMDRDCTSLYLGHHLCRQTDFVGLGGSDARRRSGGARARGLLLVEYGIEEEPILTKRSARNASYGYCAAKKAVVVPCYSACFSTWDTYLSRIYCSERC